MQGATKNIWDRGPPFLQRYMAPRNSLGSLAFPLRQFNAGKPPDKCLNPDCGSEAGLTFVDVWFEHDTP
jgi:hypothetical protein